MRTFVHVLVRHIPLRGEHELIRTVVVSARSNGLSLGFCALLVEPIDYCRCFRHAVVSAFT